LKGERGIGRGGQELIIIKLKAPERRKKTESEARSASRCTGVKKKRKETLRARKEKLKN